MKIKFISKFAPICVKNPTYLPTLAYFSKLSTFLYQVAYTYVALKGGIVWSTLPVRHMSYADGGRRHKQSRLTFGVLWEKEEEEK